MSEPIDAVADQLRQAGVLARRLREVLGLLAAGGARPLDELVRSTGVPRRDVELLLAAAQGDVEAAAGGFRLSERAASRYVERFALDGLEEIRTSPWLTRSLRLGGHLPPEEDA